MNTFSTADIARILDVEPSWIRRQARMSLIDPERTAQGHYRYSFRDLVLLRTARGLRNPGISARRIHDSLQALLIALPSGRSLSSLRIHADGNTILAGDMSTRWEPESGQTAFVFDLPAPARWDESLAPIVRLPVRETSAAELFELALDREQKGLTQEAEAAYRQACRMDTSHINARINLGRLRHTDNALGEAEQLYREALAINPRHPIALFNLGVVLEDVGMIATAMDCYRLAIDSDPEIPEAHYNLARLYARHSDQSAAVRHYSRYKSLTKRTDQ